MVVCLVIQFLGNTKMATYSLVIGASIFTPKCSNPSNFSRTGLEGVNIKEQKGFRHESV